MARVKKPDPTPMPFDAFAQLVRDNGWVVSKTDPHHHFLKGRSASFVEVRTDGKLIMILGTGDNGTAHRYELGPEYWITYGAYPYLIHVNHSTLQECDRPKLQGGGSQMKMRPAIFLSFRNAELRAQVDREVEQRLRASVTTEKDVALADKLIRLDSLTIVKGPSPEELKKALWDLLLVLVYTVPPPEPTKLWFEMADGTRYEGKLVDVDPGLSDPPELEIKIDTMPEWICYNPVSETGRMYKEP